MKKKNQQTLNTIIATLGVIVILLFSFSSLNFQHKHYLADGNIIEHSHPFSQKNHQHSENEITLLSLLDQSPSFEEIESININIKLTDSRKPIVYSNDIIIEIFHRTNQLRGPPAVL